MAHLTREQVVERALDCYENCGYIFGGYPGTQTPCQMGDNGWGETGGGEVTATDCSGMASWAWGLGGHVHSSAWSESGKFGSGYHKREAYTGVIETDFPGIQLGDVMWKNGHVVIYIGNNTTVEASTQHWSLTETATGMVKRTGARGDMLGYCSYDEAYSQDYDPSEWPDVKEWPPTGGEENPPKVPWQDDDEAYLSCTALENRYTRRYEVMRGWRNAK